MEANDGMRFGFGVRTGKWRQEFWIGMKTTTHVSSHLFAI